LRDGAVAILRAVRDADNVARRAMPTLGYKVVIKLQNEGRPIVNRSG
jgi:hypothetical protein